MGRLLLHLQALRARLIGAVVLIALGLSLGLSSIEPVFASDLQEVAPPGAAQQLGKALGQRQPQLELLSPSDGSLLPDGPWTLKLRLSDWPLVQRNDLGPGPHLVIQQDNEAPIRIFEAPTGTNSIEIPMAALTPGSHRLSAYAALPWGEAVANRKARGNWRFQRLAANPQALPAPNSPQLVAVPSPQLAAGYPVPINWFLVDAPLQNLKPDDAHWRLRLSLDGAASLLQQEDPLWLAPLDPGSHALGLELLDGNGTPLGAPFNSLMQELKVPPRSVAPPAMFRSQLQPEELEALLNPNYQSPNPEPVVAPEPVIAPEPLVEPEAVENEEES